MTAFSKKFGKGTILGCVDVGQQAYWWDYGRLGLYMDNNLFVTDTSASAHALRVFLKLQGMTTQASTLVSTTAAPGAVVLNCKLGGGKIDAKSVLCNVVAPSIDVEGCVLVNVTSSTPIVGRNGMLYNVVHGGPGELKAVDGAVRADVFMPGGVQHVMNSSLATDGGKAWKKAPDEGAFPAIAGNPMSFEGIYKANGPLDVTECTNEALNAHKSLRAA